MYLIISTKETGNQVHKVATLCKGDEKFTVFFIFGGEVSKYLTDSADPYVLSMIFIAMQLGGGDVNVQGAALSASLKDNLIEFSKVWHRWFPDLYGEVSFSGNIVVDNKIDVKNAIVTTFSGGLDSAYLNYSLVKGDLAQNSRIRRTILIQGADIPLSEEKAFQNLYKRVSTMTGDLGINLVTLKTNVRDYIKNWEHAYGTVIAGALHFFQSDADYGLTADYSFLSYKIPYGLNPFTDQYLSSKNFQFKVKGVSLSRTDRAAVIKDWSIGLNNLFVCWEGKDRNTNCGKCEKCIRTILNFKAVGVNHLGCMTREVTEHSLTDSLVRSQLTLSFYKDIAGYGREHKSLPPDLMLALSRQIRRWEVINSANPPLTIRFYKQLLRLNRKLYSLLHN